jgi:hypothetical protein
MVIKKSYYNYIIFTALLTLLLILKEVENASICNLNFLDNSNISNVFEY